MLQQWRVRHITASPEHPKTNGFVEKMNGTLGSTLAAFVNFEHTNWDEHLAEAVFSINTAKQATTELSPLELVYGRKALLPHESAFPWPPEEKENDEDRLDKIWRWIKMARRSIIRKQENSKLYAYRFRKPDPLFVPGEQVLVVRRKKTNGRTKNFMP